MMELNLKSLAIRHIEKNKPLDIKQQTKLINNHWVHEEITREILKHFYMNNENKIYLNLWDAAKAVFSGNFTI